MTDLTGKLIANSYKDLLTINSSATNEGVDGTLRRVQDGSGNNTALELSQNEAKFYGDVAITGTLSVPSINLNGLDVSAINVVDLSATNINTTNITVNGDGVATSAALTSVEALISSNIVFILNAQASVLGVLSSLAAVDTTLQSNINQVSVVAAQNTVQTSINAVQIGLAQTSIAANASAITVNSSAITSINNVIGTLASANTSATLESRIAAVSSTMATSIANVSATLESRIASVSALTSTNATAINSVSAALVSTSGVLTTNINTVSAGLSIANVSIAANSSAIAVNSAAITSVNAIAIAAASAGTSATLETRIATVSSTMATSISNSNSAIAALSATMATSIANHLPLSGGTLTGPLILNADPTLDLGAATKQYVDNLTAAGIHFHEAVRFEQPGPVSATYDNGTAGVGATLTNAGTQAILVVDGVTASPGDRILIYEQVSATQNGVYVATTVGSPSTNWVLTRSSDTDTAGPGSSTQLDAGSYFFVTDGNTGAGESYICNVDTSIVFGTTDISFVQFSSALAYTAGTNINISGDRVISTSGVPTNAELAAVSAALESRIAGVSAAIPTSLTDLGISDGTAGQFLQTNGSSVFTFVSVAGGGSGTVTNIKAGSNISMTEAGTTVTETTTSATIAVTASPTFSSAVITGDLTVDTDTLVVDSANNRVGIGTVSPNAKMNIEQSGTGNFDSIILSRTTGNVGDVQSIVWQQNDLSNLKAASISGEVTGASAGALVFNTATGGTLTERARIDSSGRVGIGTTDPSLNTSTYYDDLVIKNDTSGSGAGITIQSNSTNGFGAVDFRKADGSQIGKIYASSGGGQLAFETGGNERLRIDSSGNVGINNSSPNTKADIIGSTTNGSGIVDTLRLRNTGTTINDGARIQFTSGSSTSGAGIGSGGQALNSADLRFYSGGNTERMRLETDGDLHVDGNVVAYSTTISDKRLKKDIQPIENALWKVNQINGCTFTYLKDDRKSAGLIAQDLEKVLPSAVIEDKVVFHGEEGETYKTVQYDQVIGLLVEAVKELTAKVERLENGSSS
jgi:hypothetical protein